MTMSAQPQASRTESHDSVLCYFEDSDLGLPTSNPQDDDDFLRQYVSRYFATDLRTEPPRTDLERLLSLAREREQFCRGANDNFGLARCLGNQALIQKARSHHDEALALLRQLE